MSIARESRMLAATIPDAWAMAERFRPYCSDQQEPIERPEPVEDKCRPLSASLYTDCVLCRKSIALCDCDPDEAGEALWLHFQSLKGGQS